MTDESTIKTISENGKAAVIKPWLSGGLVLALVGNIVLSGVLIFRLGGFEDIKRQAQEAETATEKARMELTSLQFEVDSLKKQKDALTPTIVDWEKRLKEKAEAEAFLATLESKRQQTDADILQAVKQLSDVNKNLTDAEKRKGDLDSEIERLQAEHLSLTKRNTDVEATLQRAREAERRLSEAQSALASAEAQRKQLEADIATTQARHDQIQKEADSARETQKKLADEATRLRQEIQNRKDEQANLEQKVSDLKARQAAVQQEEQKLVKLQQQVSGAEARLNEIEREEQKLARLQQQVSNAEARLNEVEERQRRATSEAEQLTNRLEQIRKDVADWELRRDVAKTDFQQADSDLAAARKLFQEASAKQGELIRESSLFEAQIERLKKEKETLEKELGRLEGETPKSPTGGQ
jgi:chromosome segregation ATPase